MEPVESDAIDRQVLFNERSELPGVVLRSSHVHTPALLIPDDIDPLLAQATAFEPVESDAILVQSCPNRPEFPDVVPRSIKVHVPALLFPDHMLAIDPAISRFEPVESDAI